MQASELPVSALGAVPYSLSTDILSTQNGHSPTILSTGTTNGGKVRRRMRSRFQKGCLQESGDWVVVRFRIDTPAGRELKAEKVCPRSGPGLLTKAEQKRRAAEIIQAAGVNNAEQIKQTTQSVTFAQQAERFLEQARTRRRKPISPATYDGWRNCLDAWLIPNIGETMLQDVNNGTLKTLVTKMVNAGLSAKTVNTYSGLVKLVVASAIDVNGEELYPRKWNHDFVEMPLITNQHRPTFTSEQVTSILAKTKGQAQMLILLAAATGLRLGELLGLSVEDVSDNGLTITVRKQAYRGRVSERLKTTNAHRVVDVYSTVAIHLVSFIGNRTGLLFPTSTGRAHSHSNVRNRMLYPVLKEMGVAQTGFHGFRRFRATHLRKQQAPESLIKSWLGHSAKSSVTDLYDCSQEDGKYRKQVAEQVGIGFELPSIVLSVLKLSESEVAVAA
jgi:integrase